MRSLRRISLPLASLLTVTPCSASTVHAEALIHRGLLTRWLATPDIAVGTLGAGVLLIFLECNLPGAILPGALGLLLVLSGIYGLSLLPLHSLALLLLVAAAAVLALSTKSRLFFPATIVGAAGLVSGLLLLIDRSRGEMGVHPAVAISVGLLVGVSASLLGRVAGRARRNKAVLASGSDPSRTPDLP